MLFTLLMYCKCNVLHLHRRKFCDGHNILVFRGFCPIRSYTRELPKEYTPCRLATPCLYFGLSEPRRILLAFAQGKRLLKQKKFNIFNSVFCRSSGGWERKKKRKCVNFLILFSAFVSFSGKVEFRLYAKSRCIVLDVLH